MLYPMFAMIVLTIAVAVRMFAMRVGAVRSHQVRLSQFRLNTGEQPDAMIQVSRNYTNLFEIPILFYVAGILTIVMGMQTPAMIVTAWVFVAARFLHSGIHLTYNNVMHRLGAFLVSVVCVVVLWSMLVVRQASF